MVLRLNPNKSLLPPRNWGKGSRGQKARTVSDGLERPNFGCPEWRVVGWVLFVLLIV
jgi:hypothetical protein